MLRTTRYLLLCGTATLVFAACSAPDPNAVTASQAIIGGTVDTRGSGVVAVFADWTICTGVMISPTLVLTTRLCVTQSPPRPSATCTPGNARSLLATELYAPRYVSVSTLEQLPVSGRYPPGTLHRVREIFVPTTVGEPLCGADVALLELEKPVSEDPSYPPPQDVMLDEVPEVGSRFFVRGYGASMRGTSEDAGLTAGTRRQSGIVDVQAVGPMEGDDGNTLITQGEWVAEAGVCTGGSGAPAFDALGRLIGIATLRGRGVSDCRANIFLSLSNVAGFLRKHVRDDAERRDAEPPAWALEPTSADADGATDSKAESGCRMTASRQEAPLFAVGSVGFLGVVLAARRRRSRKGTERRA
jgi:hypothetical protein